MLRKSLSDFAKGVRKIAALAAGLVAVALVLPAGAWGSICTDTWTGSSGGAWQTGSNWSTGLVPSSSDVACIGAGETVKVTAGTNQASVLQDEGTLVLTGGSLELVNGLEASRVSNLTIEGGNLKGAATLDVSGSLLWEQGDTMSGLGSTVLQSGGTATINIPGGSTALVERSFVNEGTVTFSEGQIWMSEGASITNTGTFKANSQTGEPQFFIPSGSIAPSITNTGTFEKTAGAGTTEIGVSFENRGLFKATSGALRTMAGGSSNSEAKWEGTGGGSVGFKSGSFSVSGGTWSGVVAVAGGTVSAEGVAGSSAHLTISVGTLNLAGSAVTVEDLTMEGGTLTGAATLNISNTLLWEQDSTMSGSGSTVVESGASATIHIPHGPLSLIERAFVNEGTTTFSEGQLWMSEGAKIKNAGTFKANTESGEPQFLIPSGSIAPSIVNTGTFEKTAGSGTTEVEVNFENQGTVKASSGSLKFSDGGSSSGTNKWMATGGATISFIGGTFSLNGGTWSGAIDFEAGLSAHFGGATVTAEGVSATAAQVSLATGTLSIKSGSMTVGDLTILTGTLTGAGTLNVSATLSWEHGDTMSGTGSTVLLPGGTATINIPAANTVLKERTFVNEGTTTFSAGQFWMSEGGQIENKGTFKANSETGEPQFVIMSGSVPPQITNSGTFEKTSGTGKTEVEVNFENLGAVQEEIGRIEIQHPVTAEKSTQWGGSESGSAPGQKRPCEGDPVNCATGNFSESQTDLAVGGRGVGLQLTRTYNSQAAAEEGTRGSFGYGWSGSFSDHLTVEKSSKKATLHQADGGTVPFTESSGKYTAPAWSQDTLGGNSETGYTVGLANQTVYKFKGSNGRLESVTDRNGNATTLAYSGAGRLETITDPAGRKITLTYNSEGLVESAKDPMGHVVKYTYESGNLASVTEPGESSARWQFKYDGSHEITTITDARGGKTVNEYNGSHQVTSQKDPAEHTLTFEYEAFHTKITNTTTGSVTDERFDSNDLPFSLTRGYGTSSATTETFTYDTSNNLLSVTDGNGHTTKYTYDGQANRTSMVDPEKDETTWTYDSTHDVKTVTTPNGETTTIKRDSHGNAEAIERPAPGGKTQVTKYKYDGHGNVEKITDPLEHVWKYAYDNAGDRTAETDAEAAKRTWEYNEDSQPTAIVSPRGNISGAEATRFTTKIERDEQGRPVKVTDPLAHTTKYAYDANGNLETLTDGNGHKTTYTYNADNEPTKVKQPNGITTETEYDGAGRVISQTDGNKHTTKYARNAIGEVTEITDPLGRKTTKEYDPAGNLTKLTDPEKRSTTYTYDTTSRLKEVSYSDGKTHSVKYAYDPDGNRTSMTDATGTSSYTYDQLDRLTESKDGHGNKTSYEYDLANEPTKITYPNGKAITRTYDKDGRLQKVTDWSEHATKFTYDANSNLTATTYPTETKGEDRYAYNEADQMTEVKTIVGTETRAAITYTRDSDGQLKTATVKGLPGEEKPSYTYDENNRITKAGSTAWEYDNANNPTKIGTSTYTYGAAGELEKSTGVTYTYDKEGERTKRTPTSGPATTYGYDQAGNLTTVTQPEEGTRAAIKDTYTYDGNGLRATQSNSEGTKSIAWDMDESTPQILNDGQNSYIYGPNGIPIEQINAEGKVLYLHHDQQGSTRLLTGQIGNVEGTTTYDPYGNQTGSTGTKTTPLGYDGQYTNTDTGLIYLRARAYDPATARFLSVDPINAITSAPYTYAEDNPLNALDPSGLSSCGSIPVVSTICNGLQESGISNGAAGALNFLTFGASTELAGSVFGFNSECASFGTGGKIGMGLALGLGLFDGATEAELGLEGLDGAGNVAAGALKDENVLGAAERYLGEGYREIAPGVYRSADGARQFRMTPSDLNATTPHVHFEAVGPDGKMITENAHVNIGE